MTWENKVGDYNQKNTQAENNASIKYLEEVGLFVEQNGKKLLDLMEGLEVREKLTQIRDEIWKAGSVSAIKFYGLRQLADNAVRPMNEKCRGVKAVSFNGHSNIHIEDFTKTAIEKVDLKRYPAWARNQEISFKNNPPLTHKYEVAVSVVLSAKWETSREEEYWTNDWSIRETRTAYDSHLEFLEVTTFIPENTKVFGSEPVIHIVTSAGDPRGTFLFPQQEGFSGQLDEVFIKDIIQRKSSTNHNSLPYSNRS